MPDNTASVIERNSPTPYYDQLFVILSERIASGTIPVGEKLASEHELCEEFGLSRATVRQALSKLENEGLAERIPRRGVFAGALVPRAAQHASASLRARPRRRPCAPAVLSLATSVRLVQSVHTISGVGPAPGGTLGPVRL